MTPYSRQPALAVVPPEPAPFVSAVAHVCGLYDAMTEVAEELAARQLRLDKCLCDTKRLRPVQPGSLLCVSAAATSSAHRVPGTAFLSSCISCSSACHLRNSSSAVRRRHHRCAACGGIFCTPSRLVSLRYRPARHVPAAWSGCQLLIRDLAHCPGVAWRGRPHAHFRSTRC